MDSLFDAEMFWLTDEEVLSDGLVDEEPFSLVDVEIVETLVDKDGAELLDCDALGLTDADASEDGDTFWLRLVVALWDVGSDFLADDCPLTVTDTDTLTDALVEDTGGPSVCETFLDALTVWIDSY
jgi:hypothetical protein